MNFDESVQYLLSLGHETVAMKLGLKNTETLLHALGEPQKNFLKVQIAGTNGKGSTAAFLDSICCAANIKTGLFTSPHLVSITERIKINGEDISEKQFAKLTERVKKTAENLVSEKHLETLPTFFEHLTAIGLLAFAEETVDLAILETGLGGRLDSTTAAAAEIVCLTAIDLDHQEYLGDSLAEITAEKAAIVRPGVRAVVVAPQKPEAAKVIRRCCRKCRVEAIPAARITKTRPIERLKNFEAGFKTVNDVYSLVVVSLPGRHQLENAATAISLAESLRNSGYAITPDAIVRGLETARHAGRLEFSGNVLFDGAHNAAGAKALQEFLREFIKRKITLVFGAMRDKDLSEVTSILFPLAENLILTRSENPRSAAPKDLREFAPKDFPAERIFLTENVSDAIKKAREITAPDDLICITGSLYLIGEAKSIRN